MKRIFPSSAVFWSVLAFTAAALWLVLSPSSPRAPESPARASHQHAAGVSAEHSSQHEIYTCSMHPEVQLPEPGQCPICGMDLVRVTRDRRGGEVVIDHARRQLIGVKTALVIRVPVVVPIRAVGRLVPDETQLTEVTLKFDGWIGSVFDNYTGAQLRAGAPLYSVYSPELLSAQEEFLSSLRRFEAGASRALLDTTRRRLRLWGMSESQIDALGKRGRAYEYVTMPAPIHGTLLEKKVVDGSAISAGEALFKIADLSVLWVEADIYEADLAAVKVGQQAQVTLSYLPGKSFTSKIAYVYPSVDPVTRTGRVRLELPNPDGVLMPEMYVDVELRVPYGEQIVVPGSAVLLGGKSSRVFVDLGEGRLAPREVKLGRGVPDGFIVSEGLSEGERIVTSGNFLIAAESKLKSGVDAW